jgi:hypothetical protein
MTLCSAYPTMVDRLGVWLSQRAIGRYLPRRNDLEVLELGCGYHATQLIALNRKLKRGIGVDFQIAPELQALERFTFHEGTIEETLPKLENEMVDVVMLFRSWNIWTNHCLPCNPPGGCSSRRGCC